MSADLTLSKIMGENKECEPSITVCGVLVLGPSTPYDTSLLGLAGSNQVFELLNWVKAKRLSQEPSSAEEDTSRTL